MRFAITAVDRNLGVFDALLAEGWEPVKLFTVPHNPPVTASARIVDRSNGLDVPVQVSRMTDRDLRDLAERGCEALVCASYNWRIGDWRAHLKYAVNFHPSPLPDARGPYPAVRAILEGRTGWGVTCHKIEPRFDAGDILDAERFALSPAECHESLDLKSQMAAARLARRIGKALPRLWDQAEPQTIGRFWPLPSPDDRILDFQEPVEAIMRRVRAFGLLETVARINGRTLYVRRAAGWTQAHRHRPGSLVHADGRRIVIAASDGYIGLLEWSPVALAAMNAIGRPAGVWQDD
jgi:methionyl-tRNA formyltransferase